MNGLSWLNHLHNELETCKRFLVMDEIQSLSDSVVGEHKKMAVWKYIRNYSIYAQIKSKAPRFLEDLEKFYTDYEWLTESILRLSHYVREELKKRDLDNPLLNDILGTIFREILVDLKDLTGEQRHPKLIVEDVFDRKGIPPPINFADKLKEILNESLFDSQIPTFDSLREKIDNLIAQIDKINNQVKIMIENDGSISDYGESVAESESEFYHG